MIGYRELACAIIKSAMEDCKIKELKNMNKILKRENNLNRESAIDFIMNNNFIFVGLGIDQEIYKEKVKELLK